MLAVDRRAVPRYRVSIRAEYAAEGARRCANLFDLAADGVFICTPEPLQPGSRVDLTIHTPEDRGFVYADGLVVWTNLVQSPGLPAGMGIRFLTVDQDARRRLQQQLQSLS